MANSDLSEPLHVLIQKIPFSFVPGHLRGPGVSLSRILGGPSIEPFFGGGSSQRAVSTSPPPPVENRPPLPMLWLIPEQPPGFPLGAVTIISQGHLPFCDS